MADVVFLVDTNVILRFLLEDDPEKSAKAVDFLARVATNEIKAEIPSFIIAECIYVLSKSRRYQVPKIDIVDNLIRILDFPGIVNPDRADLMNALLIFKNANYSFADCMLASLSNSSRRVVSFDSDFNTLFADREIL